MRQQRALMIAVLVVSVSTLSAQTPKASVGCAPLSRLAELVSRYVETPVLDRTGPTGNWGGTLYFAADSNVGPFAGKVREPDPGLPSFTSALQDQFGIRLESTRGPVEVMVIDSVRQPTEN